MFCLATVGFDTILAQTPARRPLIGLLAEPQFDEAMQRAIVEPFRKGLNDLGHVENRNVVLELRSADGQHDRLPALARQLIETPVDVLVAAFPAAALAAKGATQRVPIVAVSVDNPVAMGLAATMARPGGNITGISSWGGELLEKRLQLLREIVRTAERFGILFNPDAGITRAGLEEGIMRWGRSLRLEIRAYEARKPADFADAFAAMAQDAVGGLLVLADGNTYTHRKELNELCLQSKMPSVWGGRDFLTGGALASYQSDFPAIFKRAATLVDYILKGRKPGEIPFEQATKLELIVDQRAARKLNIRVPRTVLLAADAVIE